MVARAVVLAAGPRDRGRPLRSAGEAVDPDGQPRDGRSTGTVTVESPRGEGVRASARPAQALPAGAARGDARLHLLGIPGPADHDRRGDRRGRRPGFALPWSVTRVGWGCSRTCSPRWSWSGSGIAVCIRKVQRPGAVQGIHRSRRLHPGPDPRIILTLFLLRGARIALGDAAYRRRRGRRSRPLSRTVHVDGTGTGESFFAWFFLWAHVALVLGFLVYMPYSKHLHIITSAINVWFASTRPRGALEPLRIDMEALEAGEQIAGRPDACRTSRGRSCWTSTRARNAAGARASARRGTRASRCPRSC